MSDLTPHTARHDDSTSRQHGIDVAGKKERNKTHYEAVPALEIKAGSSILDGVFKSPIKGFSFRMKGGSAMRVNDPAQYTRDALKMSRERARYLRIRIRDGKERRDWGRYKSGAVSLVTTLPPWAVGTVSRIGPHELADLMLAIAEAQSARIQEVSGRPTYGGGIHLDTAVPHTHSHIPKTDEKGNAYPKSDFLTGGPWLAGAVRIEKKFPGLLNPGKRELMERHLARKNQAKLVDLQANDAIDAALERWIRERGLWSHYQADCAEYVRRKGKAQREEPLKRLMQASLGHHHRTGVWPLAYSAMTMSMWRLVPRELRVPIMVAIRLAQVIRQPTPRRVIGLGKMVAGMLPSQPTTPPFR
jgi:hypothetical protein